MVLFGDVDGLDMEWCLLWLRELVSCILSSLEGGGVVNDEIVFDLLLVDLVEGTLCWWWGVWIGMDFVLDKGEVCFGLDVWVGWIMF